MLRLELQPHFSDQIRFLTNARVNNRLAHAYLLYGDNRELRDKFVALMWMVISCPETNDKGEPCETCKVCDQIMRNVYPDQYQLAPTSKSRQIKVGENEKDADTVRWFEHQFYLSSTSATGKKLGLIDDADCMNTMAQNAFLKTLEEPPENSYFVLATANPSSLLNTIISRCQQILLLTNTCKYTFAGTQSMFRHLFELQFNSRNNLPLAENCAQGIIEISSGLQKEAEQEITPLWEEKLQRSKETDSAAQQKRLEDKCKAAIQAAYLLKRQQFLSAIHTWFSQVYQLACNVPLTSMANAEIISEFEFPELNEESSFTNLETAEKLLNTLSYNVNEELAFREFCLGLAYAKK